MHTLVSPLVTRAGREPVQGPERDDVPEVPDDHDAGEGNGAR
jgi:hypothetical protein